MDKMVTDNEPAFKVLCAIVTPIAKKKHGMIGLYLFGSKARQTYDEDSDYDFCLVAPDDYGPMIIGSFLYDLQEVLEKGVDLICEEGLETKPDMMKDVLRDRRLVFEA